MEDGVNITKQDQEKYKRNLDDLNDTLLSMDWSVDGPDFDEIIEVAISIREKINDIELELIVDRVRKKIFDGGLISVDDLSDIESTGWVVPEEIWNIVRNRS